MTLCSHSLELQLSHARVTVQLHLNGSTIVRRDDALLGQIPRRDLDAICESTASLARQAATLADRIEQLLGGRLAGRERVILVTAARYWLRCVREDAARTMSPMDLQDAGAWA
ncbi:hypothetical protein [Tahibacter amnicola]|uniref:Uncharacterized protein n=1 Tax=Tahibacter amnicola TaxID=2976241 RepID=A0ABY6BD46_9GAMM|nr:hypothetical protein [Tahibacter amnicola]UXI67973.1 hypothetical protein N4264_25135 [Tahibacter amnicola]